MAQRSDGRMLGRQQIHDIGLQVAEQLNRWPQGQRSEHDKAENNGSGSTLGEVDIGSEDPIDASRGRCRARCVRLVRKAGHLGSVGDSGAAAGPQSKAQDGQD